jgi:hypothetical protein
VQQAADEPFWIRREDTCAKIGDANDKEPPGPKETGLLPCCCEDNERSRAQTEERERHLPAKAAQLVFPDQMGRVELRLHHLKRGKNGQERDAKPIAKIAYVCISSRRGPYKPMKRCLECKQSSTSSSRLAERDAAVTIHNQPPLGDWRGASKAKVTSRKFVKCQDRAGQVWPIQKREHEL